ncbi:MAG: hypothetical protein ACKVS8_05220 [Phycisphaerales bacterium]
MPAPDRVYITILQWPGRMDIDARVEALAAAAGIDPRPGRRMAEQEAPLIVDALNATGAKAAIKALRSAGIAAIGYTHRRVDELLPPFEARRLVRAEGSLAAMYMCEPLRPRRDEPRGLLAGNITLIVRARLAMFEVESTTETVYDGGPSLELAMPRLESAKHTTKSRVSDVIDVYEASGRAIRINGDKFHFDVLGEQMGVSDNSNADRLAMLLAEQAPRAHIDLHFEHNAFDSRGARLHAIRPRMGSDDTTVSKRDDAPAFDFYSAWLALAHRTLLSPHGRAAGAADAQA